METKENLYKELTKLTVERNEIKKSIEKLSKTAGNLSKGEQMTEIVPNREVAAKLKELEKKLDVVERKWKEVWIKYKKS